MGKVPSTIKDSWFPGHMARSLREIKEKLPLIDLVIEVADARIPMSSRDQGLQEMIKNKPRLLLLSKMDLADSRITSRWMSFFEQQGITVIPQDLHQLKRADLLAKIRQLHAPKRAKEASKGILPRPIRVLVCGMPNVGKSTLINQLAKRRAAKVENRPGVTTSFQWITLEKDLELLDMPGILYPKNLAEETTEKLAFIGMSSHHNWHLVDLGDHLLQYLLTNHPEAMMKCYQVNTPDGIVIRNQIAATRGFFKGTNELDIDRAFDVIIRDFRDGKIGRFTLEAPSK